MLRYATLCYEAPLLGPLFRLLAVALVRGGDADFARRVYVEALRLERTCLIW
jgi:hypothetical protein